jgi:transposase-like protein
MKEDGRHIDRETRIGAVADYLLGKSYKDIEFRWNVTHVTVLKWVRKAGCFKLRHRDA